MPEGVLFRLLDAGLHPDRRPAIKPLTAERYAELFLAAKRQGVAAIVWSALEQLPAELQPPRSLKLQWALHAERIAGRSKRQQGLACEMGAALAGQGIRTVILKGLGLSRCYPTPAYRECGDIDIFLGDGFECGNRFLLDAGARLLADVPKHSEWLWRGVMVENHRTLLNVRRNADEAALNDLLENLLEEEAPIPAGEGLAAPGPTCNALYLLRHAALHYLRGELALRHLCDWSCFLEREGRAIDRTRLTSVLEQFGMREFAATMTAATIRCCGTSAEAPACDPALTTRFVDDVLRYGQATPSGGAAKVLWRKIREPFLFRHRYRLLHISLCRHYAESVRAQMREKFTLFK